MAWIPRLQFRINSKAKNKWIRGLVEGEKDNEIALRCDVSKSTIKRWNKKYNIPNYNERIGFKLNDYLFCIEQLNLGNDYCIHNKKWAYDLNSPLTPMDVVMKNNPNLYWFRCEKNKKHIWKENPEGRGIQVPENFHKLLIEGEFEDWVLKNTPLGGRDYSDIRWWGLGYSHNRDEENLECPYCIGLKPFDGEKNIFISNINQEIWRVRPNDFNQEWDFTIPKPSSSISKSELEWLKEISEKEGLKLVHQYLGDGYCPETNTIFEFYGDIWHGNPNKYSPNDFPCYRRPFVSAKILYLETKNKENMLKMLGFNLETIWESDYLKSRSE